MEKKNKAEECQIALIGASQSGKTTLAAGLAKTSDEKFTVGFADKSTRDYLEPIISSIDCGKWPLASNCEDTDLVLSLHMSGGRSSSLSFKEYKGEKIGDKTYVENLVGHPRGALILLNPGMDVFHADKAKDEEEAEARVKGRVKMINDLKNIIDYLKEDKTCAAIALVVTAFDRLSSDLKPFRADFENYLLEITNHLRTSGMTWKRFEVTITGKLVNQEEPSFKDAANAKAKHQARAPFIWLMKRICVGNAVFKIKKMLKIFAWSAVVGAGIACACLGWMFYREQKMMAEYEARAKDAVGNYDRAMVAKTDNESDMNRSLQDLHEIIRGSATNHFWFSWIDARRTNFVARALSMHDSKTAGFLNWKINKFRSNPNGEPEDRCRTVDKLVADFNSGEPSLKEDVRKSWESARPQVRERYDSKLSEEIKRKLREAPDEKTVEGVRGEIDKWEPTPQYDSVKAKVLATAEQKLDELKSTDLQNDIEKEEAIAEHETEKIKALGKKIDGWAPLTSFGAEKKNALKETFDARSKVWYQEIADRKCRRDADSIVSGLPTMGLDEAAEIRKELEKIQAFPSAHANARTNVLKSACEQVSRARTSFLTRFSERFSSAWKETSKKRPELSKSDEDFVVAALDLDDWEQSGQKFSRRFLESLKKQCVEAGVAWEAEMKSRVEKFIAENFGAGQQSATDLFAVYRGWYEKNDYNPYISKIDARVAQVVSAFFDEYVAEVRKDYIESDSAFNSDAGRQKAGMRFQQFQRLCMAMKKDGCGLANTWCEAFARDCVNLGQVNLGMNKSFAQELEISQIDVKVSEDGSYNDYRGGKFGIWVDRWELQGQQISQVLDETYLKADEYQNYIAKEKNVYQTIFNRTRKVSLNPWSSVFFNCFGTLDLSGTGSDAQNKEAAFRLYPLRSIYDSGSIEREFKCTYQAWGGLQSYTCTVKIHCTFSGPDFFEIYKKHRQGR